MSENWIALTCHPSSRSDAVRSIQVRACRPTGAALALTYRLEGDVSRIVLPAPSAPRIGVELWRHTCFEAFVGIEGRAAYHEFNFAPSGEWTVYAMRGYREGGALRDESMRPEIAIRSDSEHLELDAFIRLDHLSAQHVIAPLRLGINAVIEAIDGHGYWGLRHPREKPDFHDAGGFTLVIEPPAE